MQIRVRLFAILREQVGSGDLQLELREGASASDAVVRLQELYPPLAEVLTSVPVVLAVNRSYVEGQHLLEDGDEVAMVPPVSGGCAVAGGERSEFVDVQIFDDNLSIDTVTRAVGDHGAGAIVTFQGVTRDIESLEYEAYREMAVDRMHAICVEVRERHGAKRVAAHHRVGSVPLSKPSVIVAASAAHRHEAFAAARELIDRIKAEVPIWKRELDAGSSSWVEGVVPQSGRQWDPEIGDR